MWREGDMFHLANNAGVLQFTRAEWNAFVAAAKLGQYS